MTAFSEAFRAEVLSIARKEIKADVGGLRKTVTAQRSEIAALKRDVKVLTSQLRAVLKAVARPDIASKASASEDAAPARRGRRFKFDAQVLVAKREQLGLSQQAMAALLEASALSVSLQAVLKIGKQEAKARLLG